MINWIKGLFKKSGEVINEVKVKIKERVLTDREKQLLYLLERDGKHTDWKGKKVYTLDGTYNEVIGYYSYYDIETTKKAYVLKDLDTGWIKEFTFGWLGPFFFDRKPHSWVSSLPSENLFDYYEDSLKLTDDELFNKYFNKLPKEDIREIKLKELGI
jgi:hypothetical protein